MTYRDFRAKYQKEVDEFPHIFFAFSREQFAEGCKKHNVSENNRVVSIGAGGYVLSKHFDEFENIFKRRETEFKVFMQDYEFALEAFTYEFNNHEYCISQDIQDTLESLDLTEDDINGNPVWKKAFRVAERHCRRC